MLRCECACMFGGQQGTQSSLLPDGTAPKLAFGGRLGLWQPTSGHDGILGFPSFPRPGRNRANSSKTPEAHPPPHPFPASKEEDEASSEAPGQRRNEATCCPVISGPATRSSQPHTFSQILHIASPRSSSETLGGAVSPCVAAEPRLYLMILS